MAEEQTLSDAIPPTYSGSSAIIAAPSRDYRWKRYLLVAVLFGYGLMSINDGFFRYPRENEQFRREHPDSDRVPHAAFDVPLNKGLGILLPPFAIAFLIWCLYNSRGEYRFDGTTLQVPGHPPIPLLAIRKIDRAKWDRKGIAYIEYQLPGTTRGGRVRIDDFVYQREPTDRIFEQIEAAVSPGGTPPATSPRPAV